MLQVRDHITCLPEGIVLMIEYGSFLIRIWRTIGTDPADRESGWKSEMDHIQSGHSWSFNSIEELFAFLQEFSEVSENLERIEEQIQ